LLRAQYALIEFKPLHLVGQIGVRNVGGKPDVKNDFSLFVLHRLALTPSHFFIEKLGVEINSHGVHETVLLGPEQISRAANLKIAHRKLDSRPELAEFLEGFQALARVLRQRRKIPMLLGEEKVAIGSLFFA